MQGERRENLGEEGTFAMRLVKYNFARRDFLKGAGAAILGGRNLWAQPVLASDTPGDQSAAVSFDPHSFLFNGKRKLLISGELHYARSTRAMWPALLDRSKALGLNCIATYVFWNLHEPERDVYDFAGERDLGHFLELCKAREIYVFLRVGPYCCAEWNYGGYPPYLRDEPNITIRTMSPPYLARVEKYFERLANEVNPHLATRGGPVALIQVENEYANVAKRYGPQGQEYLRWMAQLAKQVGFADVPTTMCEGAAGGPISTVNGFEITAKRIEEFRSKNDRDPLLWTELYPSWYDTWGVKRETGVVDNTKEWKPLWGRDPRSMALAILTFLANGGAGWNYYMWHGGTNFGRNSMYLQTTSYDFRTALDEYGRPTLKGVYLGRLHKAIQTCEAWFLEGKVSSTVTPAGAQRFAWNLNGREVVLTLDYEPGALNGPDPHAKSAKIVGPEGKTIFDTQGDLVETQAAWKAPAWEPIHSAPLQWHAWSEPMPPSRAQKAVHSAQPIEQLLLTHDHTDYCWYSTKIDVKTAGPQELLIPYGGDFFYIYLDGKLAAQTTAPLKEDRGPITPEDPAHPRIDANSLESRSTDGYRHEFNLSDVAVGTHRLDILATALGMIKGDWQIASPMNFERKGIWEGVLLNGAQLNDWDMIPFLAGETIGLVKQASSIQWSTLGAPKPLCWHKTEFQLSAETLAADADYRLNAAGLGKGMLFLNGHGVGRHWLVVSPGPDNLPTQQFYHLPKSWLSTENTLIVFEEQAASPKAVQLERRRAGAASI
jgi:hypothetical protein